MLLRSIGVGAVSLLLFLSALPAHALELEDSPFRFSGQVGVDAWDINTTVNAVGLKRTNETQRLLYLADSTPQWTYRNPSPWLRFDSEVTFNSALSARLKFRGDQASDWRVDELNVNWSISPSLGLSAGVVDYKTSWCRTYNVESPWVRENDPFCTVRTTDQATGAAPGLQFHSNWLGSDYLWQAQTGIYNPLLIGYEREEFSNQPLSNNSKVKRNVKVGTSISAVHLGSGAEWRLSYLRTDQAADFQNKAGEPFFNKPQKVHLWFTGVAWDLAPNWQARLTYLQSDLTSEFVPPDLDYRLSYARKSRTAEIQWKPSGQDTLIAAQSFYKTSTVTAFRKIGSQKPHLPYYFIDFANTSWSLAWRRDWSSRVYSSLQWTRVSASNKAAYILPGYDSRSQDDGRGHAIGFRVGWRF